MKSKPVDQDFLEIEHKFLVDESFDKPGFFKKLERLTPLSKSFVSVSDTYFFNLDNSYVFRHRIDPSLQQLTLKSKEQDPERRVEVNLYLDQAMGDQLQAVQVMLKHVGRFDKLQIKKFVDVFYFKDCEIVYYQAQTSHKKVHCVEFEALDKKSAKKVLEHYEKKLEFDDKQRCTQTLLELLL